MILSAHSSAHPLVLDGDFFGNPYPAYAAIREAGNKPVEVVLETGMAYLPPGLRAWLLTSYEDIELALGDPRFRKELDKAMAVFGHASQDAVLYDNMANNDPPNHTRLRKPLNGAFTARAASSRRDDVRAVAHRVLDELAGVTEFDLVEDFALPFSIEVICGLLGVPVADRHTFASWAQTITSAASKEDLRRDAGLMAAYLRDLMAAKRSSEDEDVLALLARHPGITEREGVSQAYALLVAGYETTANLIAAGLLALESEPGLRKRLWTDPALVPGAVQEMLRHQSPFNLSLYRYVSEDVEVGGTLIPAGSIVFLAFAAANRDEQRFGDPDAFDVDRPGGDHIAFGGGVHNCIGKHLAKVEAEVAFEALIERCPDLEIRTSRAELEWKPSPTFRGVRHLLVGPGPAEVAR
ncbi:cytochrome P450 [Lentzea sp. NPDC051838]|uniref:cytochrome P450 family protein n=1 Tax=Lentzea sp. NPDC051838 TaxID=3154849 RepID=UPI003426CD5A